jgi:hypothetical protein
MYITCQYIYFVYQHITHIFYIYINIHHTKQTMPKQFLDSSQQLPFYHTDHSPAFDCYECAITLEELKHYSWLLESSTGYPKLTHMLVCRILGSASVRCHSPPADCKKLLRHTRATTQFLRYRRVRRHNAPHTAFSHLAKSATPMLSHMQNCPGYITPNLAHDVLVAGLAGASCCLRCIDLLCRVIGHYRFRVRNHAVLEHDILKPREVGC